MFKEFLDMFNELSEPFEEMLGERLSKGSDSKYHFKGSYSINGNTISYDSDKGWEITDKDGNVKGSGTIEKGCKYGKEQCDKCQEKEMFVKPPVNDEEFESFLLQIENTESFTDRESLTKHFAQRIKNTPNEQDVYEHVIDLENGCKKRSKELVGELQKAKVEVDSLNNMIAVNERKYSNLLRLRKMLTIEINLS